MPAEPGRKKRLLRWIGYAAAAVVILVLVAGFFVGRYLRAAVDADRLEVLLNEALADATDGLYTASLDGIQWRRGGLSLRLTDLSLMLDREVLVQMDEAGTTPAVLFQIQHATVDVDGVDPWALIRGDGFRALSITVDEPLIQLSGLENVLLPASAEPAAPGGAAGADDSEPETEPKTEPEIAPADPAPARPPRQLRVWRISVNRADVESYRRQAVQTDDVVETFSLYERFTGLDIAVHDLNLDGDRDTDASPLSFVDDLRIDIDNYYYQWPDGLHEESHGPISLSTGEGFLRIQNFNHTPTFDRRERVDEDGWAPLSRELRFDSIRVEGLDVDAVLAGEGFRAEQFLIDGGSGTVLSDLPTDVADPADVTAPVTEVRPGALITQALSGLPAVRVDSLQVHDVDLVALADRDAQGNWLEAPIVRHRLEDMRLEAQGYESIPGMDYDPTRPFLSDTASASATGIVATLGGGDYRLELGEFALDADQRSLSMADVQLVPLLDRRQSAADGEVPGDRYELSAARVDIEELDYGSLIDHVDVNIGQMTLASGSVRVTQAETSQASGARRAEQRLPREVLAAAMSPLPNTAVQSLQLTDWRIEAWTDRTEQGWLDEPLRRLAFEDLNVQIREVLYSEVDGYDVDRPFLADSLDVKVGKTVVALGDGYQTVTLDELVLSEDRHEMSVAGLTVGSDDPDPDRLTRRVREGLVPRVTTGPLRLTGPIVANLIQTGEIEADLLELQAPRITLLQTAADPELVANATPAEDNTQTLLETINGLPIIKVGELRLIDAAYERRVGARDHDWRSMPETLTAIHGLNFTLRGLDTDPDRPARRLMFSDGFALTVDDLLLDLGDGDSPLALEQLALSSESDTLTIGGASYSTRDEGGNDDFAIGPMELTDVPYGRTFRSLYDPPASGNPVLSAMVDRDTRLRIDSVVGTLDDGRRRLTIGPIEGRSRDEVLSIDGVDLRPTLPDADPSTPQTEFRQEQTLFSMARVELTGVNFPRLAGEGVFEARRLAVDAPSVAIVTGIDVEPGNESESGSGGEDDGLTLADRIDDAIIELPAIRIGQLRLGDIEFEERRSLEGRPVRVFGDIQLAIDGLDVRSDRPADAAAGVLYAADIRLDVPQQRTWLDDVGYEIDFGPIALSTGDGTLELGKIAYVPPYSVEQYLTRTRVIESGRLEIRGQVGLSGIDFARLLREEGVYATNMRIDDLNVHVLDDKKKPNRPRTTPPTHPHEALQNLDLLFGIDRVDLSRGAIRYSERHAEGDEPGHLWFDRLGGTITNLSNDPARMTFDTPVVLNVEARMLDQAFLRLQWRIPLLEPGPTMSFTAAISPFEIGRLSSILRPLEGIRITSGTADQAVIDIDIRDGRGTGTVNFLYRDLKLQLEDRNTGGRSLGQRILSFAANVILPSNNRNTSGEPERLGIVDYEVPELKPFFGVFWDAIKAGVVDLVT